MNNAYFMPLAILCGISNYSVCVCVCMIELYFWRMEFVVKLLKQVAKELQVNIIIYLTSYKVNSRHI